MRLFWGLVAGLGAALLGTAAAAKPAQWTPGPCVVDVAAAPMKIDCGTLTVDETRGSRSLRRVTLPVAIVRAAKPTGAPPIVYLHGGPGGGAVERFLLRLRAAKPGALVSGGLVGQDQDWIVFDQRGGGLSTPMLDCGELPLNDAGVATDGDAAALKLCGKRHAAAGVDLSRYNAVEVAKDVQDLRQALRLEQIDLLGVSYGTRIATAIQRTQPQGVRAVVLDSPWPSEARWIGDGPKMVADAARGLLIRCLADAECGRGRADLPAKVDALARRWLAAPQTVDGVTYPVGVFGQYLMDAGYSGADARALPNVLEQLTRGDFSRMKDYLGERSPYHEAQFMTHLCKEEFPFETRAQTVASAGDDPLAQTVVASLNRLFDACAGYSVGAPDPAEALPVSTPIPTLFIAAEIDPGCPPELAYVAAARFTASQVAVIKGATHGSTTYNPCAQKLALAFLADPKAKLNMACAGEGRFAFAKRQ